MSGERPVYLRLRDLIVEAILDRRIREGEALPSVRSFAADQGANPLTVAKAYQTFQEDGIVTVRRGIGLFVAAGAVDRLRAGERRRFLDEEWPRVAATMRRLELDPADLIAHD